MPIRPAGLLSRRTLRAGVLPLSLVATAAIVAGSSYSVFTANTSSPTNAFTTGSVALTNDSASGSGAQASTGSALFTVNGITPTSAATVKCITVQSTGSVTSAVKLYAANVTNQNNLSDYLNLTVEIGTATNSNGGTCNGFSPTSTLFSTAALTGFTAKTTYAAGVATGWTPSSTDTRVFRITVAPSSSMTNTQQNSQAKLDFVWEADNT